MVVSCKQDVYDWFQKLDAPSRVEFFCTLLKCHCSPWEIRFYGTCLEQRAQESHGELKRHTVNENYHRTLHERMMSSTVNILDRPEDIGALIMYIAIYLKSKPSDAVCTRIPFDIIMEIGKQLQLRMQNSSEKMVCDKHLQEDICLLLTLALHHPAFAFSQHEAMRQQLQRVTRMFGRLPSDRCFPKKRDAHCQTDNSQQADAFPPLLSSVPSTPGTHRIDDLNLLCSKKVKPDIIYTIEVKYNRGEVVILHKSHQDIKLFHDKILSKFPEDVKSPKDFHNIPQLNAGDSSESVIANYLRGLCRVAPEFLESKPMLEFFLPQDSLCASTPAVGTTRANVPACDTSVPPPSIAAGTNKSIPKQVVPASALLDSGCDNFPSSTQTFIVTNSTKYPSTAISAGIHSKMVSESCTSRVACHPPPATVHSSQMLQMSKEDLKAKGMGDDAVKKLSEHLEIVNSDLRNNGAWPGPNDSHSSGKVTVSKSSAFPTQTVTCDSSSSDLSPRTSPYSRPGVQVATHTQDTQHRQLVFTTNSSIHVSTEPHMKSGRGVQRSRSSNNLYAFPASSTNNVMTVSAESWYSKPGKEATASLRSPKMESVSVTKINSHQPSTTNQPNSRLTNSTSKGSKPAAKSAGNRGLTSPRMSEGKAAFKGQSIRQSEPGQSNGPLVGNKSLTVEEIQQRQREQSLQRHHSHDPSSSRSPLSPDNTNSTQPPPPRPPLLSQPQQSGSVAQVSISAHPTNLPPSALPPSPQPSQQVKSKQTSASRKQQKSPAQTVHRGQPTPPPPVTNQQAADQSLLPCPSPSSLSTQSASPVLTADSNAAMGTLTTASSLDEQMDGESDGFSLTNSPNLAKSLSVGQKPAEKSGSVMSNGSKAQHQDSPSDALDDLDITMTTGQALAIIPPYLPNSVEELPYVFLNGYKPFSVPAQDVERIVVSADGCAAYSSPCTCAKCVSSTQFYMSVPPPSIRPSHPPPPNMPQHQNNMVYQGYSGGFISTSNGLVSPGMPSFNRPNTPGGLPPNGLVQRGEMVYQPVAYVQQNNTRPAVYHGGPGLPPQFHQQMPSNFQFYPHPHAYKKPVHCTNCGLANHSRNDCLEPLDTSGHINQYHLDMQPRTEIPE